MKFVKLYHSIWSMNLSPTAFRAYCVLLRYVNTSTGYASVSMNKAAKDSGVSPKSL